MRRRRVVLITAKWVFTALAALVIIANVASQWRVVQWVQRDSSGGSTRVWIVRGAVWVMPIEHDGTGMKGLSIRPASSWNLTFVTPLGTVAPVNWHLGVFVRRTISSSGWSQARGSYTIFRTEALAVTLLYPFVLFAAPAGLLWWIDQRARRRGRRGQCNECGYDHAGLPPGTKCPECGTTPS